MNVERKKNLWKKIFVCLKGPPLNPLNTLRHFSAKSFNKFSTFKKMHFKPIQDFFHKNMHAIKELNLGLQDLQTAALQQSFSQCWWKRHFLEGSLIQKPP